LHDLAESCDSHCVSIYMPIMRGEFVGLQNPTRIKNLLTAAEASLVVRGLRASVARDLAQAILAQTEEPGFWEDGSQGLAVFASETDAQFWRLPQTVPERWVVGRHYNITPLLPLEADGSFIILELTRHDCRALRGQRFSLEELESPGLPVAARRSASEHQRHVSVHGAGRHGAQLQTVITGQGEPPERSRHEIEAHFRAVDAAMVKFLADSHEPMVIAALASLASIYRQVNTYEHLEPGLIEGNPGARRDHELHRLAWEIVASRASSRERRVLESCLRLTLQDPTAFTLPKILVAAHQGRVATLLVMADAVCWGTFDPATEQFRLTNQHAPGAEDLLNLAAIETMRYGGQAFATDLSQSSIHELAAAQFRYDDSHAPAAGGQAAAKSAT
jgi:hypothetical protein